MSAIFNYMPHYFLPLPWITEGRGLHTNWEMFTTYNAPDSHSHLCSQECNSLIFLQMGTTCMINDPGACNLAQDPQKSHRITIQTKYALPNICVTLSKNIIWESFRWWDRFNLKFLLWLGLFKEVGVER